MDEKDVLILISELERCNEDYLIVKRENKLLKRKNQFGIKRIISVIQHRIDLRRYKRKYEVHKVSYTALHKLPDTSLYMKSLKYQGDEKIAVYSCISGDYDNILEPRYNLNKNITYIMFTDKKATSANWEIREIPGELKHLSSSLQNRYIKLHPHEFLKDFDYSIYVDGSVEIISDLSGMINLLNSPNGIAMHMHYARNCVYQEAVACQVLKKGNRKQIDNQIERYRREGFPDDYGLLECGVIVTDLHNEKAKAIYDEWWEELLKSESGRDQFSLPYVLWRRGIMPNEVGMLGDNLYFSPKIRVCSHN